MNMDMDKALTDQQIKILSERPLVKCVSRTAFSERVSESTEGKLVSSE